MYIFGNYVYDAELKNRVDLNQISNSQQLSIISIFCAKLGYSLHDLTWRHLKSIQDELLTLIPHAISHTVSDEKIQYVKEGKIQAIKSVREMTGMGLKDAKDYVEAIMSIANQPKVPESFNINGFVYKKVY